MPKINLAFHKLVAFYIVLIVFVIMAFLSPEKLQQLPSVISLLLQFSL